MKFPSIEQYGEALQFPENTILDPKLRKGKVQTDTFGLPWGRSGAFALTFKITTTTGQFAFRCFQSQRDSMRERYAAISSFLSHNKLTGFVHFQYLDRGITIQKIEYPVVTMDWAAGQSLGAYIEENLTNKASLTVLQKNLEKLAKELENAKIAHGDIQSQNILVTSTGELTLIDYDGMFVPALSSFKAIESGHRNFQHPQREKLLPFDSTLDRFPLALLHTALAALIERPGLWEEFQCHPEKILFTNADLVNPNTSKIFRKLNTIPAVEARAKQLAAFAQAPYGNTPKFTEYLRGDKPESATPQPSQTSSNQPWYMNPDAPANTPTSMTFIESIVDARKIEDVVANAGTKVQLIGKITNVELGKSDKGLPHAILTLSDSTELKIEVALWAEGVKAFAKSGITVDNSWTLGWIAVTGELSSKLGSSNGPYVRIVVTQVNQIERISHQRATYLIKSGAESQLNESRVEKETISRNENLISGLGKEKSSEIFGGSVSIKPSKPKTTVTQSASALPVKSTFFEREAVWFVLTAFGVIMLIIGLLIAYSVANNNASGPNNSTSNAQSQSPESETIVPLSAYEGMCLTIAGELVECTYQAATRQVVHITETPSKCPPNVTAIQKVDGWICVKPFDPNSMSNVALETCIEATYTESNCFPGEGGEYFSCWNAAQGALLQQRKDGQWVTVKRNIAIKDDCMPGYPWTIAFVRKASGVGEKSYRLYIPPSGEFGTTTELIQVTVREA